MGGVLAPSGGALSAIAEAFGVLESELSGPYWKTRDSYDLGGSASDYWREVAAALGRRLDTVEAVRHLDGIDVECWAILDPDAGALLAELTAARVAVGVLSNAPASLAAAVRAAAWSRAFDTLVFSSDIGLMKPDPLVYKAADAKFAAGPAEVVFFDDRKVNVAAARRHGWRAHQWTGCDDALAVLVREGILGD